MSEDTTDAMADRDPPGPDALVRYPVLPLNNMTGLPGDLISFTLQNSSLIELVQKAHDEKGELFTTCTRNTTEVVDKPVYGTLAGVAEINESAPGRLKFRLSFSRRAEMVRLVRDGNLSYAEVRFMGKPQHLKEEERQAFREEIDRQLVQLNPLVGTGHLQGKVDFDDIDPYIANVARTLEFTQDDKRLLLEGWSIKKRLDLLLELLGKYAQVHKLRKKLRDRTSERLKKMEKDAFLEEERRIIDSELGRSGKKSCPPEFQELRDRLDAFKGPAEVLATLEREFTKMLRAGINSPHAATTQDYIENLLDLPWNTLVSGSPHWKDVERSLLESHFGLDKVKEKILRFLAINHIAGTRSGSIMCFIGPPGVGKTSFARAIAGALGLPYVKASLGGVRDESEIRGHRRTYVGALPGRIIQGIRKAKCMNPVFLLDEVDKMGHDHRGNPADALLEVLDPEENSAFSDHYVEQDFDLSKVFWILTANSEAGIPAPLRDRMEMIDFSGYTEYEKVHIALEYLVKRNMEKHGLQDRHELVLGEAVCRKLIREYTREAGVRELDRKISNIVQHFALRQVRGQKRRKWAISGASLAAVFGPGEFRRPEWTASSWVPGVMAGLAWTASGGSVLRMECSLHPGKGDLRLTGKLGEVMKESAHTAFSFIKDNAGRLGLERDFQAIELHIHIPSGAVSKEGPSAGMGLALVMYSILSGRRSRPFWALTGEISLHGRALAIGGVREKLLAAQQEGFEGVVLPRVNRDEVGEIPKAELEDLKICYVSDFWDAFPHFFSVKKKP